MLEMINRAERGNQAARLIASSRSKAAVDAPSAAGDCGSDVGGANESGGAGDASGGGTASVLTAAMFSTKVASMDRRSLFGKCMPLLATV